VAILWSSGTMPPRIACTVCLAVRGFAGRWTLRCNRCRCFPSVDSNSAMAVPVASTAWVATVQPNTELAEQGTGTVVLMSMALNTAEAPLDSVDKTTTGRTYKKTD